MFRAVTGDHVLFDECIDAFRRENNSYEPFFEGESSSYLLTAFELSKEWELGACKVGPSKRVNLPGAYSAFISKVDNPSWVGTHNSHVFGIALSSIVSFVTQKPCKSTRDNYLRMSNDLSAEDIAQLALLHPILTAGPGATHTSLSQDSQLKIKNDVKELLELLYRIDYKSYRVAMQSIRMAHLSLTNKRDDFGLAYLLVVSAIEVIAQKAIEVNEVKEEDPNESLWKERAKEDDLFKKLLKLYSGERKKQKYLAKRFVRFIRRFAPVGKWIDYVAHPLQDIADYLSEISPSPNIKRMVQRNWFERYPEELDSKEIDNILRGAYNHRSSFIHSGDQPPHSDPNPSFNRFFQVYREYDGYKMREEILPNYELLIGLAKHSLINWLRSMN